MLDNWTITDVEGDWDFRVVVESDADGTRPENDSDIYNADTMLNEGRRDPNVTEEEAQAMAQWARDAVKAWEGDLWQFATVTVTPVLKTHDVEFTGARVSVGRCDYGWLPGSGKDDKGTWTDGREYVRTAWANDLISEAKDDADEQLAKVKGNEVTESETIERMAQTIVDHAGADMANARAAAEEIIRRMGK